MPELSGWVHLGAAALMGLIYGALNGWKETLKTWGALMVFALAAALGVMLGIL